jgi:hypothetical protein
MTAEEFMENVRHAGGEVWAAGDKLRYRLPSTAGGLVREMRELKPELLQLLRPCNADCWAISFASWAQTACVYQPRRFSEFSALWIDFCEWCANRGDSCMPSRATFDQLLRRADFLFADGIVSSLALRCDD